jgi:hypothetical protein
MGLETLALGALGIGSSIMQSNSQNSAARNATAATQASTDQQTALYRDIYNQQRADYAPFRQYELQQANAMGELFGFDPVGQPANGNAQPGGFGQGQAGPDYGGYVNANPDLAREYNALGSRPGGYAFGPNLPQSYDANGDGSVGREEYGQFHFDRYGQNEGRSVPQMNQGAQFGVNALMQGGNGGAGNMSGIGMASLPQGGSIQGGQQGAPQQQMNPLDPNKLQPQSVVGANPAASTAQPGQASSSPPIFDSALGGADRFNNSLFNPLARTEFNTQRDNIDNNLAKDGAVYSSARQNAIQIAGNNSISNNLGVYLNTLMGSPSMNATNASANAGQNFGAQTGNALNQQGAYQAQSAYNQGQNSADMWGGIGSAGAFALGGGNFGRSGGGSNFGGTKKWSGAK